VVEIFMIAASAMLYALQPELSVYLPGVIILTIFTLIVVIDVEHRLILHMVSGPSAILIALIGILDPNRGWQKTLLGGLAGFGVFFILYIFGGVFASLMSRLRGREVEEVAFGFGDVTLAGVIGLTVGWPGVVIALVIGILSAGLFSLLFILSMLLRRSYNPFRPIPYGPFIILGGLLVYFGAVKQAALMLSS
jgi:prepilin signal peptidase PulO-like enzyme (type II secretory pathway)